MEILAKIEPDIPAWAGVLAVKESMSLQGGIRRTQVIEVRAPRILKMAQNSRRSNTSSCSSLAITSIGAPTGFKELK